MSTSIEGRKPIQRHIRDDQSSLPTFTSVRDRSSQQFSLAESSNASSSQSAPRRSQTRSDDGSRSRESTRPNHNGSEVENILQNANGTIRRGKRASGGFLLGSSPISSRFSQSVVSRKDIKGKNAEDSTLSASKKTIQADGQAVELARRGSPLSSEIMSGAQVDGVDALPTPSRDSRLGQLTSNSSQGYGRTFDSGRNPSSFGFNTDPAQIVDMALRLNEGRRRQAAGHRYFSTDSQDRRIVSGATTVPHRSVTPAENLEDGRLIPTSASKRKSLNADPITPMKLNVDLSTAETVSPPFSNKTSPEQGKSPGQDKMHISRATQKRVDKAKEHFELAYQHRRLLSHLPPLRRPHMPGPDSRSYNPLQYVRNRKLRFRERAAIDSEGDGWQDLEKVRPWVDAVISSHTETRHDPLECVRLPPLSMREIPADESDRDSNAAERKASQPTKPRRPKSDWVTSPADLIADAFWIEQGLNKHKIYDRDNVPIYPPGTQFHFSGWRNRTPISVPEALQSGSSPQDTSPRAHAKDVVSSPLDLPTFESAHKDRKWVRRKSKLSKAIVKDAITTKKNDRNIFDTSSSDSEHNLEQDKEFRGRKRLPQRRGESQLPEGDPFAPSIKTVDDLEKQSRSIEPGLSGQSNRGSTDRSSLLKHAHSNSNLTTEENDNSDAQKRMRRRKFLQGLGFDQEPERGRSSFEDDNSTAPGTPNAYGFPSIAISLSPPGSRDPSPTKKGKGSFFDIVKDKVHTSKDKVDRTDFAEYRSTRGSRDHSSAPRPKKLSLDWSRGPSPMGRGPSPLARQRTNLSVDESAYPEISEARDSAISKVSSKTNESWQQKSHRVRGIFKGGRIAELVGNEVSKVSDFIWKKEPPIRRNVIEDSNSGYESDTDEMLDPKERPNKNPVQERPTTSHSYTSTNTNSATPGSVPSKSPPRDVPQFHIQGLPSFTSPFQRDREEQEKKRHPQSPGGTPQTNEDDDVEIDPISTAAARRRAGKSPRLDRLAPPRLDIESATPDGRRNSYGFGTALDLSRTRSASQLFNSAINGQPSKHRQSGRKSALGSLNVPPPFSSSHDLSRMSSQQEQEHKPKTVTVHDFIRTRALILASAIKATNIAAYCDAIPKPQSAFLFSVFHSTNASGSEINKRLPVPRKEEHVVAAHHIIEHLNMQSHDLNNRLDAFTRSTTTDLHRQIQILEDRTESTLFPRLSRLSDQAGQLAQKLTTTSTLAVKGVNDEVLEAIRLKRRGPFRWSRLLGYKLMEFGVVGLLWVVWFVVTSIRIVFAFFKTLWAFIAWLLFLR